MSATAQILITLVLVGAGVTGYHFVAAEAVPANAGATYDTGARDLADLERRLAALEGDEVELAGLPAESRFQARLADLEERLAAVEKRKPVRGSPSVGVLEADEGDRALAESVPEEEMGEVDPDAVLSKRQQKAIRDLINQQRDARNQRRGEDFLKRRLDRLGIELTDDQRKQVTKALDEHREKARDLFRSLREEGKEREEIRAEMTTFNAGLTETLSTFLPSADAEAISTSMTQGGGPGGGRRGPGGGR